MADSTAMHERLIEVQEMARFTPERVLPLLPQLEAQAKRGTTADRSEFLTLKCSVEHRLGRHAQALPLCEQALELGQQVGENDAIVRAMLYKAYVVFSLGQVARSHQLAWDAERLAATSRDADLRVRATVSSADAFAEEGNFPAALAKLQAATTMARQSANPLLTVIALDALAYLYNQMHESGKAFEALDEAIPLAAQLKSPGHLAMVKSTEYALAMDAGQTQRGLRAMQEAAEIERRMGAGTMLTTSLVNLSDCYLKLRDYPTALSYAQQALVEARRINDNDTAATARVNIGQVYLTMGRLAEGKKFMEEGMAQYEKSGNKPDLQAVLVEYGEALERAGDLAGALRAYHRERVLSNELFEARRQKAVVELQEKYAAENKQRQIELLQRENQVKSTELDNRRLQQRIWWLLALVFALASVIVGILYRRVRSVNALLEVRNSELKQQSARDPLTGLYNRRHFQEFMRTHQPGDGQGALYLLDADHFKQINDTYGHAAGDEVLREIAEGLRDILRETDMIVRWGGEEFLAYLPAARPDTLDDVARRLLCGIPARQAAYRDLTLSVNVSIGYAPFPLVWNGAPLSWERTVNLVDMALYLAKAHGRNRAYGIRRFTNRDGATLEAIEQDMERAWQAGQVDLSVTQCEA